MKRILIILACLISTFSMLYAQDPQGPEKVKVYCEIMCTQYNLFKEDVNAIVDFGIADKAKNANGWIYDSSTNKKYSFSSPMAVFKYMADRGWEYKDAIIVTEPAGMKGNQNVWHFILVKELPANYTNEDIIGNIDYRNK